ncbi:MAG TPA: hypothetical protein GXZ95_01520 [Mollicutes bacterium]|nr:hypothetical protein [Mollicutes bacterium]
MKLIDKYNMNKESNNNSIILLKSGIFYKTFNNDAYIIAYLFKYKINKMSNYVMVGFPEKVIENIEERLIKEKVAFIIIDEGKQSVSDKGSFVDGNYEILLDRSCKSSDIEMEIERIKSTLDILKGTKSIENIISKIKEII